MGELAGDELDDVPALLVGPVGLWSAVEAGRIEVGQERVDRRGRWRRRFPDRVPDPDDQIGDVAAAEPLLVRCHTVLT